MIHNKKEEYVDIKTAPFYDRNFNMHDCEICRKPADYIRRANYDDKWKYLGVTFKDPNDTTRDKDIIFLCKDCYEKETQ